MNTRPMILLLCVLLAGVLWAEEIANADATYSITPEPREDKLESMLVAGYEVKDSMDHEQIMKCWMNLMQNYESIKSATGDVLYGVTYFADNYDPKTEKGYAYLACTQVSSEEGLPKGIVLHKVPASNYLVFEHKGSLSRLEQSFTYIFEKYLPNSKREFSNSDVLETYDYRYNAENPEDPESLIEIWIPVKALE